MCLCGNLSCTTFPVTWKRCDCTGRSPKSVHHSLVAALASLQAIGPASKRWAYSRFHGTCKANICQFQTSEWQNLATLNSQTRDCFETRFDQLQQHANVLFCAFCPAGLAKLQQQWPQLLSRSMWLHAGRLLLIPLEYAKALLEILTQRALCILCGSLTVSCLLFLLLLILCCLLCLLLLFFLAPFNAGETTCKYTSICIHNTHRYNLRCMCACACVCAYIYEWKIKSTDCAYIYKYIRWHTCRIYQNIKKRVPFKMHAQIQE